MISSMGNGFTFPLQTIIFVSIVKACYRLLGISFSRRNGKPLNYGVFGDDIIVCREAYNYVCHALQLFGFIVNSDKSYNTGSFRESCGGDYWRGVDVRGLYIKKLKTATDVYSSLNRLVRWCTKSGYLLTKTFSELKARCRFLPVPLHAQDTEGIKVPYSRVTDLKRDPNGCIIYRAAVLIPNEFRVPSDETRRRRYPASANYFRYNASGLLVSLLGGYIRNERLTLRLTAESGRFKLRKKKTINWDSPYSAQIRPDGSIALPERTVDLLGQVDDWKVVYELLAELS